MIIQDIATGARDIEEANLAGQESSDRFLVGGIEHRAARSPLPGNFISQL
jgi:hypothetical protein